MYNEAPIKKATVLENIFYYPDIRGDAKFVIMIEISYDYKLFKIQNYLK